MANLKWIERRPKKTPNEDDSIAQKIGDIRGIKDLNRFLSPTADELFDPYLLMNVEDASNRIIRAIANGENILVDIDADADGLTSFSIMYRHLKNYTDKVDYIYGERSSGHGIKEHLKEIDIEDDEVRSALNKSNVEKVKNADLLILIDSSSNDTEMCKMIKELGVDIIVLDHHEIEQDNPHVLMVNPQQLGCQYPNKQLSGAGVVFKVLEVMEETLNQVDVWQWADLVAVGMYADIMRVDVLENRYLIMHGLRNMKNPGLLRILKGGKADMYNLDCNTIGFTISPLLNGAARMDNIKLAIDILIEDDDKICMKTRLKMFKLNESRKEIQKELVEQYSKSINLNQKMLVVLSETSSKGFNGLICQNLSDRYKRPSFVGRIHKGTISGSCRSYGNFNLKTFISELTYVEAIGHEGAFGLSFPENKLDEVMKYIEENAPDLSDTEQTVIYDLEIEVNNVPEYMDAMKQFNLLTGKGFPKIIVRVNGITVDESKVIGKTMETVKITTFDQDFELIKFRVNEGYASELVCFDSIDVVGTLGKNEFYNFALKKRISTNQVMIEDYIEN